jgi:hypothetical protein
MEVFGFPCQAISMFKLQEALHGVLQRRKANPHGSKKKTAVPSLAGFLFCEPFYEPPWNDFDFVYRRNYVLVGWVGWIKN